MNDTSRRQRFNAACMDYIETFCRKQGLTFEYWVPDQVGQVAVCVDFYFNFHDIVWDVDSGQPEGLIIKWYDECLTNQKKTINYPSYSKGMRF